MNKFKKNQVVEGCVSGIEKYGIFVTLDEYYNGLIHISEISDSFIRDINKYVQVGETIKVRIIESDDESFHVKLSIKNLNYRFDNKYEIGIQETIHGFSSLKDNLLIWIKEKEEN